MKYLLLIYENEAQAPAPTDTAEMAQWDAYTQGLAGALGMEGGAALEPTASARTVRLHAGEVAVTDGPFAETKEQLGGFYLVEAANRDEVIAWAAKMPHVRRGGCVEVRPVVDLG